MARSADDIVIDTKRKTPAAHFVLIVYLPLLALRSPL